MKRASLNHQSSTLPRRRFFTAVASLAAPLFCLLVQGCSTTGSRAGERSAAIGSLPPAGRQLALHGDIQKGFSKDAVYVAWGAPSEKTVHPTPSGPQECWTYVRTFNGVSGGYFGISRGLVHDKHGDHYDTNDYYPAPDTAQTLGGTPSADVPVKRVTFEQGKVVSFETANSQKDESDVTGTSTDESMFRSSQEINSELYTLQTQPKCVI